MRVIEGRPTYFRPFCGRNAETRPNVFAATLFAGLPAVGLVLLSSGCGPALYTMNVTPAAQAVEQAREAGAAEQAPYEYYYAEAHLTKAREEAASADYEDAMRFAQTAQEYGIKARDLARRRLREEGR